MLSTSISNLPYIVVFECSFFSIYVIEEQRSSNSRQVLSHPTIFNMLFIMKVDFYDAQKNKKSS